MTVPNLPPFCAPWTGDAKAYPTAASVADALVGLRRKRRTTLWKLRAGSPDMQLPCAGCGATLAGPISKQGREHIFGYTYRAGEPATGHYLPSTRAVALYHYLCSWNATMADVLAWGRRNGY